MRKEPNREPTRAEYRAAMIIVWETMVANLSPPRCEADTKAIREWMSHLEYLKDPELGEDYAMEQVETLRAKIPEQYEILRANAVRQANGGN